MAKFHLRHGFLAVLAVGLMATACQKNIVVLLPNPDGTVGHVTVTNAAGSVEMNAANTATTIRDNETIPGMPAMMEQKDIENLFGDVLERQPQQPVHFILYFEKDSTKLRPASLATLDDIVAAIRARGSKHISVVGHSDTLGDKPYNLDLSRRRAVAVKKLLVGKDVQAESIRTTSHGEENPLVKTADNVGNAKNRRVEVVVR